MKSQLVKMLKKAMIIIIIITENSTVELLLPTQPLFDFDVLSVQRQTLQTVTRYSSYRLSSFSC